MYLKRAFTLIELLVVIAIIAILAAILFPVFAQAKVAAKGAASISNLKQLSTGLILYSADYDDPPPIVSNNDADSPFLLNGLPYKPWSYLMLPYMKNGLIAQDPLTEVEPVAAGFDPTAMWLYRTQFGYAYTIHAPVNLTTGWIAGSTPQTTLADPANTVLIASKKRRNGQGDWLWVGGPIWMANLVAPPVCPALFTPTNVEPLSICPPGPLGAMGWGAGSPAYAGQSFEEGGLTGGVSVRKTGNSIVAWADGHVSTTPPSRSAEGTNWTRTTNYLSVTITDITKYKWDKN